MRFQYVLGNTLAKICMSALLDFQSEILGSLPIILKYLKQAEWSVEMMLPLMADILSFVNAYLWETIQAPLQYSTPIDSLAQWTNIF